MSNAVRAPRSVDPALHPGMVPIPAGTFQMGSNHHYPEEAPAHEDTIGGFWMDRAPLTNAEFSRFVAAARHVTFAERPADSDD